MKRKKGKMIKCIVWDLDNTLWDGILLEDRDVKLRKDIKRVLRTLDERGILLSIASKNEHRTAMEKLVEMGLDSYFLYPQINWNSKSHSIKLITEKLNINTDSIAFVDDSDFELDEVKFELPEVMCIHADDIPLMLEMPELDPVHVTEDARMRRQMYLGEIQRSADEESFRGPKEAFLSSLDMQLTIFRPGEGDLQRAAELTQRTNQLNTTGYSFSRDELQSFLNSEEHLLLMAKLKDKYGDYGRIGLMIVEKETDHWTIKLLLMSCRVMTYGIGSVMLSYIINLAGKKNKKLFAEFLPNERNRLMNVTYKFMNFKDYENKGKVLIFKHYLKNEYQYPEHMRIILP